MCAIDTRCNEITDSLQLPSSGAAQHQRIQKNTREIPQRFSLSSSIPLTLDFDPVRPIHLALDFPQTAAFSVQSNLIPKSPLRTKAAS